jgi:hypothetical protein
MHPIQAIRAFFRVLVVGERGLLPPPPPGTFQASAAPAVQVLGLLQKEGRLVDFLMEDIAHFSDADIGAAVRPIHANCRKMLAERFAPARVIESSEGSNVDVPAEFDASAISLAGNVSGIGPRNGKLRHAGWRATKAELPTVAPGADPQIIAPAEVEV